MTSWYQVIIYVPVLFSFSYIGRGEYYPANVTRRRCHWWLLLRQRSDTADRLREEANALDAEDTLSALTPSLLMTNSIMDDINSVQ